MWCTYPHFFLLLCCEYTQKNEQINFEIKTTPQIAYRGAFALKDFNAGDEIAAVPATSLIALENNDGFPSEHAYALAVRMATNLKFTGEFSPYFLTLPHPNETLTSETFTDELVAGLQSPELELLINRERGVMAAVYLGRYTRSDGFTYEPLSKAMGEEDAFPLPLFAHLTSLVSSREFSFHNPDGTKASDRLAPGIDMINNNPYRENCQQFDDGHYLYIRATTPIQAGDELFLPYLPGLEHRNDMSLSAYGFVRQSHNQTRPLLPATDLVTYDRQDPYKTTPASDVGVFYGKGGSHNTEKELERLQSLLRKANTTLEEDELELGAGSFADWKEEMVVKFRVERKKAVHLAMRAIKNELGIVD